MPKVAIGTIEKEGFTKDFWQSTRSSACKRSGVGKALDDLKKLGIKKDGKVDGVKYENLKAAQQGLMNVLQALTKARGKTKNNDDIDYITNFKKVTNSRLDTCEERLRGAPDPKAMQGFNQKDIEADNKKFAEAGKGFAFLVKDWTAMAKTMQKAKTDLDAILSNWSQIRDEPGNNPAQVDQRAQKSMVEHAKKIKYPEISKKHKEMKTKYGKLLNDVKSVKPKKETDKLRNFASEQHKKATAAGDLTTKAIDAFLNAYNNGKTAIASAK